MSDPITDSRGAELERLRALTCVKWTAFGDDVLASWVADMDFSPAPVCREAVAALAERGDFGYNDAATAQLPEVWAEWQERSHGWRPEPAKTRLFCDVMQGVETALWLNTEPGDGVVIFTPVYPPFFSAIRNNGRRVVECALGEGWRIEEEALEAAVAQGVRAILTCNPHNPTGRVFDEVELGIIAEVAERHDLVVISDEIWADLVYPGAKHVPLASLSSDIARRTVTVTAASKAFNVAGLRCAIAHLGHAPTADKIRELPGHLLGAVGSPGAEASLAVWTRGHKWLAETRRALVARRDHAFARVRAELPEARVTLPEATYLLWVDLSAYGVEEAPAKRLLDEGRVALGSGPDFGELGRGCVRVNFATSEPILDAVLDRVVRTVLE